MKTLLQININANIGSTGRIAEQIGMLAIKEGWRSIIAYGREKRNSASELIKINSRWSILWHVFLSHVFDGDGSGSYFATRRLIKRLERIKPDLIHLHIIHDSFINYKLLFSYISKHDIPVVWTFHDCWAFTGHCTHFESIGCGKWIEGCCRCPAPHNYKKLEIFNFARCNYVNKKKSFLGAHNLTLVSVSKWVDNCVSKSFLSSVNHIVINNGIDLTVFKPVVLDRAVIPDYLSLYIQQIIEASSGGRINVLGVAANWSNDKGLNEFCELATDPIYQIIMVGVTPELANMLPDNIIKIGKVESPKDLALLYNYADVFLNPTYSDSYPTVNIESIACGTPVVTYRTGGSPEIIGSIVPEGYEECDCGIVVPKGDIQSLETAIKHAFANKNCFKEKCLYNASNRFSKEERFSDYIKLYNTLIDLSDN